LSFFLHPPATTYIYTLSLHDALPIFPTGDVATIDTDGFMQITDRSKDVIKSGGEWIGSIDLENIAMSHPGVAMAACIAAHHPKRSEEHTSELQSQSNLVCRLLLEKKK